MTFKEMLVKFISEYAVELAEVKAKEDYKRPFKKLITKDITDQIRNQIDSSVYLVKGSVGVGRWTDVPWIGVFDNRITSSAQRGVYIVYLLNKDSKELFLTLNQGATNVAQGDNLDNENKLKFTGIAGSVSEKTIYDLKAKAAMIRGLIENAIDLDFGEISTGSKAYDAGCIFFKKYRLDDIPDDDVLNTDLAKFVAAYKQYYDLVYSKAVQEDDEWWPSLEKYNPGITTEQWIVFLNNSSVITKKHLTALSRLYSFGESATMAELEDRYGGSSDAYRNTLTSLGEKAVNYFEIPACNESNAKYWPSMYFGKFVDKSRRGNYAYKIRPELRAALKEINIAKYIGTEDTDSAFRLPDVFTDRLSRRFINSLLAKPFVILTGNSGTGKTRIATRFAKCLEVQCKDGKNYELISVGADWTDNTAILGYFNPMSNEGLGEYIKTPILKLFIRAKENPQYPFFLILDEMNLSHVERYFSDFLSHMETPDTRFKIEGFSENEFIYPDNLFVIGTVNIDETTYMFSPKVLDRANVIEFKPDKEDVLNLFNQRDFSDDLEKVDDETIMAFMSLARKIHTKGSDIDLSTTKEIFEKIYVVLEKYGFEFAYRTVKEICRYIFASFELGGNTFNLDNSIDEQIVQKLLPKIHGNRRTIGDMLDELITILETESIDRYPISIHKLQQMKKKLENTQYVSFI